MFQPRSVDGGGTRTPNDPALEAMSAAVDAATAFNSFATIIEQVVQELEVRQQTLMIESRTQIMRMREEALARIIWARDEAISAVRTAGRDPLYRPAEHHQSPVHFVGPDMPTSG